MEYLGMLKVSSNYVKLVKESEAFVPHVYLDQVGVATIGYGTTRYPNGKKVVLGDPDIDEATAVEYLLVETADIEQHLNEIVKVSINQNQFDALADFCYNLGWPALRGSTLLRKLNAGDYVGAKAEFGKWVNAGGKPAAGLIKRRAKEAALFLP